MQTQPNYSDGILNTQRMMILTEFILANDLEDLYVQHLKQLNQQAEWDHFKPVIQETIAEFEITEEEIQETMKELFKVPVAI
ncbi:hypothetical protein [Cytobacillus gottheilii]|uniref:hypothetical protein n=1 Tax=Cytobacillus gottheilii TaxID=859144 RepID=UPI0009BC1633|nr:hypothetical protein [Cytobacillus gottheilii]